MSQGEEHNALAHLFRKESDMFAHTQCNSRFSRCLEISGMPLGLLLLFFLGFCIPLEGQIVSLLPAEDARVRSR